MLLPYMMGLPSVRVGWLVTGAHVESIIMLHLDYRLILLHTYFNNLNYLV